MIIGTAGFTAMLALMPRQCGRHPGKRGYPVTAPARVGSTAVVLLKARLPGDGRIGPGSTHDYLRQLGADTPILPRSDFAETRPLEKQLWAGAVDTVGGPVLAKVLAQRNYRGCVAACGLAGGFDPPTTVMPFYSAQCASAGVDSVMVPTAERDAVWQRWPSFCRRATTSRRPQEITLEQAPAYAAALSNNIHGRTLVNIGQ